VIPEGVTRFVIPEGVRISIGLFVGGKGSRMGGVAKGLLRTPSDEQTLIERLVYQCARAAKGCTPFLVGPAAPYAALALPGLADNPSGIGPLGGLRSLLLRAVADQSEIALALACDLPFLDEATISAIIAPFSGTTRVPLVERRLQPLAAAYAPRSALHAVDRSLARGKHALMHVLDELGPELERIEFDGAHALALRDWDTPEDMSD